MAKSRKPRRDRGHAVDPQELIREVDHRAANAFQAVAAFLMRAHRQSTTPEVATKLALAATQVEAFGSVHRLLMKVREGTDVVDGGALIQTLCAHLRQGLLADRDIALRFASAPVRLRASVACQMGVLVSELVSNAAKHAFVDGRGGTIDVILSLSHEPGIVECSVEDNGVGLLGGDPLEFGMGLTTVQILAGQLGAACAIDFTPVGTKAVLRFNHPDVGPVADGAQLISLTRQVPERCPTCQRLRSDDALADAD